MKPRPAQSGVGAAPVEGLAAAFDRPRRDLFGTKAETLAALQDGDGTFVIPEFVFFDSAEWRRAPDAVLAAIDGHFAARADRLAVRSSSRREDGADSSMAGAFASVLDVPRADRLALRTALDIVAGSLDGDGDQLLVQQMVPGVAVSGVIMTHGLGDAAPYYCLNYDDVSGRTDTVTGGIGTSKMVHVHRRAAEGHIDSARVRQMVRLARELEGHFGHSPLDIEFALGRDGTTYLFQVRRIAALPASFAQVEFAVTERLPKVTAFLQRTMAPRPGLAGSGTVLASMPDWNPAEMVGSHPRPLAASLYRELITRSTWSEARIAMGYRPVIAEELMVLIEGRPYIDVRASLNSLLPPTLDAACAGRIVDAQLARLRDHPEFHDKLEFEVAATVADFSCAAQLESRYDGALDAADRQALYAGLQALTRRLLEPGPNGSLARAEQSIAALQSRQARRPQGAAGDAESLLGARQLLTECRSLGTLPFAMLARHAFAAEALLRSAVHEGALAPERLSAFKRSVRTVASEISDDFAAVAGGTLTAADFLARYGHLRPGTYDLLSPRYDDRDDLFAAAGTPRQEAPPAFALRPAEAAAIDALLQVCRLDAVDAHGLLSYAARAIAGREYGKFVFTRSLSDALESLAAWGTARGLDREALSFLTVPTLLDTLVLQAAGSDADQLRAQAAAARQEWDAAGAMKLGYILRHVGDVHIVPMLRAAPTYVSRRRVEAPVRLLDQHAAGGDLDGCIACIESADPGYDWLFTHGIAGLVTKFGGSNSHMAIRCAEFDLPAAIGCGEQLFAQLSGGAVIELDCAGGMMRVVR